MSSKQRWWMEQEGEVPAWWPSRRQCAVLGFLSGTIAAEFALLLGFLLDQMGWL